MVRGTPLKRAREVQETPHKGVLEAQVAQVAQGVLHKKAQGAQPAQGALHKMVLEARGAQEAFHKRVLGAPVA